MKQQTDLTVSVLEMPGAVGAMKASQLARQIEGYIKAHPEIVEQRKEEINEQEQRNVSLV